jgi:hypothetical protein
MVPRTWPYFMTNRQRTFYKGGRTDKLLPPPLQPLLQPNSRTLVGIEEYQPV